MLFSRRAVMVSLSDERLSQSVEHYLSCFVQYAGRRIWEGDDPITWGKRINDVPDKFFSLWHNAAKKTCLCFCLVPLYAHLKKLRQGSNCFNDAVKYLDHFDSVRSIFPYTEDEILSMKRRLLEYIAKPNVTDCEHLIQEVKHFLQLAYEKYEDSSLIEGYKVLQQRIEKSCGNQASFQTIHNVFECFFGSDGQIENKWKNIVNGDHLDLEVEKILKNEKSDLLGSTFKGRSCRDRLSDYKKQSGLISKKGKEPMPLRRSNLLRKQKLSGLPGYTSESDDGGHIESSDWTVSPSQDSEKVSQDKSKEVRERFSFNAPQEKGRQLRWSSSDEKEDEEEFDIGYPNAQASATKGRLDIRGLCSPQASSALRDEYEIRKKNTCSTKKRRARKFWTEEEIHWLRQGIEKYGEGKWALIRDSYKFVDRTSVDIRDKYRNLCKK